MTLFKSDFIAGVIQMAFVSGNVRNMAGGHLFWTAIFIFTNTFILRNVYKRANTSTRTQWLIYAIGCVLGGVGGTFLHSHISLYFGGHL